MGELERIFPLECLKVYIDAFARDLETVPEEDEALVERVRTNTAYAAQKWAWCVVVARAYLPEDSERFDVCCDSIVSALGVEDGALPEPLHKRDHVLRYVETCVRDMRGSAQTGRVSYRNEQDFRDNHAEYPAMLATAWREWLRGLRSQLSLVCLDLVLAADTPHKALSCVEDVRSLLGDGGRK